MKSVADIFRSYGVLDSEGKHVNGTDKETNHRYGAAYEKIFDLWLPRADVKLMMEVGIADGSSLMAWSEIFPDADCVGFDIHRPSWADRPAWKNSPRMKFYLGDQRSLDDCKIAAGVYTRSKLQRFDLIVEDATHRLEDTLRTFLYLWPYVRPGGLYIVEEWDNVGALCEEIMAMWPNGDIFDTVGPFGGNEPLVVFRKSL